jgi:riboflavin kinase/FMN adenylyltransferase
MVNRMLGRPFFLSGKVIRGHSRGGKILGIPTANLSTQQEVIPAKGIYASLIKLPQGIYGGAVNVGVNPTFENGALSIEAHILDFTGDLYDSDMEIHFVRRLRDERKFDSIDRLREQMNEDIEKARLITSQINSEIIAR